MHYTLKNQLYFLAGDIITNITVGTVAGLAVLYTIPSTWPMPASMFAGMLLGMLAGMLLLPIFVIFFGAMEIMIPVMLTSMFSGMFVSMAAPKQPLEWINTLYIGTACAICVLIYIAGLNHYLRLKSNG
jgi:hypothetical protein